ncbi:alpha-1,3-glucosyltransferase [Elysia marginata]|uniref:Alpha-1,3-glucosyltransferase n=1 Tax=Elysia marginata TaxID=1093978 RepID=A0AAV4GL84_9GAST|nr:alpha-1,3-glucosyltransferase [Elysia marginata]
MHGDFEAQRHWMEITSNLPTDQWYVHGPKNDLQYWGLDYPPLTAYHMMTVGLIAKKVNPDVVELGSSRGIERPDIKFFMRFSVLFMDIFLFLPAATAYFIFSRPQKTDEIIILNSIMVIATYPGIMLIDNGHFQYPFVN